MTSQHRMRRVGRAGAYGGLLRARFDMFVEAFFTQLFPTELFAREPYVEALCFALTCVLDGEEQRLLVTMPPRHLKSFCAAVMLPAFALGHDPQLKIAVVSYSQDLSREHADLLERVLDSDLFRFLFDGLEVTRRGDHFRTPQGGYVRAVSIGGAFTGIGVDILVLDDLIKANDASSPVRREEVEGFYRNTALTRFNNPETGRIIAFQQRLHLDDLASELIESGQFRHLNLPSIADRDVNLPLFNGRQWAWRAGDLLSPQRFPHDVLERLKAEVTANVFNAQYLLDPQLSGGQMADWSRFWVWPEPFTPEETLFVVQSIDPAIKATATADYSAVTTWGYNGEYWRLSHVLRVREEFPDLKSLVIAHARQQRADLILVEDANIGSALAHEVWQATQIRTLLWPVQTGKAERFGVALDRLYDGEPELARSAPGFEELRREVMGFPSGRHDDIVDTISQFVEWSRNAWMPGLIARKNGRRPPSRPRRRSFRDRMF